MFDCFLVLAGSPGNMFEFSFSRLRCHWYRMHMIVPLVNFLSLWTIHLFFCIGISLVDALFTQLWFTNKTRVIIFFFLTFVLLQQSTGAFIAVSRYASATPIPPSVLSRGVGWQVWFDYVTRTLYLHHIISFYMPKAGYQSHL